MAKTMAKKYWRHGDIRWEVEWCSDLPYDKELDGCDPDRAKYESRVYLHVDAAVAMAREVIDGKHGPLIAEVFIRKQVGYIDEDLLAVEGVKRVRFEDVSICTLAEPSDVVQWERA